MIRPLLLQLILVALFFSCISSKKIAYLQSPEIGDSLHVSEQKNRNPYILKRDDVLKVEMLGLDPNASILFNSFGRSTGSIIQHHPASILLDGNLIDHEGNIVLPYIGQIMIAGLTLDEASVKIQSKVDEFFTNVKVKVNLVSFRVTILGEVAKPGIFYNYHKDLTILQGIGLAGDLTEFGDRENIKLVRNTAEGDIVKIIDITSANIVQSDSYLLMPGDVIYVPPVSGQSKRVNIPVLMVIFSAITTAFLVLNYFK